MIASIWIKLAFPPEMVLVGVGGVDRGIKKHLGWGEGGWSIYQLGKTGQRFDLQ